MSNDNIENKLQSALMLLKFASNKNKDWRIRQSLFLKAAGMCSQLAIEVEGEDMTCKDAIDKLNALGGCSEECHVNADVILTDLLKYLGYGDVSDAYDKLCKRVGFWYA